MWECFSQLVGIASLSAKAQQFITIPLSRRGAEQCQRQNTRSSKTTFIPNVKISSKTLSSQYHFQNHFHPQVHCHPKNSFIPKHFHPKPISSQKDFDVRTTTTTNKTTRWWQKLHCQCLCEGVAGQGFGRFRPPPLQAYTAFG